MKPEQNSSSTVYLFAAQVAAQIGCLLILTVGGGVVLGLLLDKLLGTKSLFIFLFLLGSIPLNLWAVYRYTLYKTRNLKTSSRKEGTISDDELES